MEYFRKRKLKKELINEGLLSPGKSLGYRYRESPIGKVQHSIYGVLDEARGIGKKGRKKNPFGKIKDRNLFNGGFF